MTPEQLIVAAIPAVSKFVQSLLKGGETPAETLLILEKLLEDGPDNVERYRARVRADHGDKWDHDTPVSVDPAPAPHEMVTPLETPLSDEDLAD